MTTTTKGISRGCADDLLCGINTSRDLDGASDLEKEHLPIIQAPERVAWGEGFDVSVQVGALLDHPNEPSHHIEFIELYADHAHLVRMDCAGGRCQPLMHARLCLDHDYTRLRAFGHWNLHGSWEWDQPIEAA